VTFISVHANIDLLSEASNVLIIQSINQSITSRQSNKQTKFKQMNNNNTLIHFDVVPEMIYYSTHVVDLIGITPLLNLPISLQHPHGSTRGIGWYVLKISRENNINYEQFFELKLKTAKCSQNPSVDCAFKCYNDNTTNIDSSKQNGQNGYFFKFEQLQSSMIIYFDLKKSPTPSKKILFEIIVINNIATPTIVHSPTICVKSKPSKAISMDKQGFFTKKDQYYINNIIYSFTQCGISVVARTIKPRPLQKITLLPQMYSSLAVQPTSTTLIPSTSSGSNSFFPHRPCVPALSGDIDDTDDTDDIDDIDTDDIDDIGVHDNNNNSDQNSFTDSSSSSSSSSNYSNNNNHDNNNINIYQSNNSNIINEIKMNDETSIQNRINMDENGVDSMKHLQQIDEQLIFSLEGKNQVQEAIAKMSTTDVKQCDSRVSLKRKYHDPTEILTQFRTFFAKRLGVSISA
jgi:hypothetical protein